MSGSNAFFCFQNFPSHNSKCRGMLLSAAMHYQWVLVVPQVCSSGFCWEYWYLVSDVEGIADIFKTSYLKYENARNFNLSSVRKLFHLLADLGEWWCTPKFFMTLFLSRNVLQTQQYFIFAFVNFYCLTIQCVRKFSDVCYNFFPFPCFVLVLLTLVGRWKVARMFKGLHKGVDLCIYLKWLNVS